MMAVSDTPATEDLNAARGMKLRRAKMRGIAISSKSAVHVAANRPVAHEVRQLPVAAYSGWWAGEGKRHKVLGAVVSHDKLQRLAASSAVRAVLDPHNIAKIYIF